jgi:hypothetical protein
MSPMSIVTLLLMAAAVILLGLATFWNPPNNPPVRPNLGWAGMACWALAELLMHVNQH